MYYKIVNSKGNYGVFWKDGYNIDICEMVGKKGIYYSNKNILKWIKHGDLIYEITPISDIIELGRDKYKSHEVFMKYIGEITNKKTLDWLINNVNINVARNGYLLTLINKGNKYILDKLHTHIQNKNIILSLSARYGWLDLFKIYYHEYNENNEIFMKIAKIENNQKIIDFIHLNKSVKKN